jgi:hypothetical protein
MDKFVARLNVEHYRKKIAIERDEAQRQKLVRLLAQEQAGSDRGARKGKAAHLAGPLPLPPMRGSDANQLPWFPR